ncbi:hypothetical protein MMC19_002556 [Ptychographa xylographoides]|nr:hypothetical protein [Ptychographa xylographoides]
MIHHGLTEWAVPFVLVQFSNPSHLYSVKTTIIWDEGYDVLDVSVVAPFFPIAVTIVGSMRVITYLLAPMMNTPGTIVCTTQSSVRILVSTLSSPTEAMSDCAHVIVVDIGIKITLMTLNLVDQGVVDTVEKEKA